MGAKLDAILNAILGSLIFSGIGMLMFALAMWIVSKVLPFSLRKEIEEDQNTSLGIVLGSIIIGLAMILSNAIR
jgi:putative membrane protein